MSRQDVKNAAIVLLSLPDSEAAALLRRLAPAEIETVAVEMLSLGTIDPAERHTAIRLFSEGEPLPSTNGTGGLARVERLIHLALADGADEIIERLREHELKVAIETLARVEDNRLAELLADEFPQAIAVVLARFETRRVAALLEHLQPEHRLGVIHRIAKIRPGNADAIRDVIVALCDRAARSTLANAQLRPLPLAS